MAPAIASRPFFPYKRFRTCFRSWAFNSRRRPLWSRTSPQFLSLQRCRRLRGPGRRSMSRFVGGRREEPRTAASCYLRHCMGRTAKSGRRRRARLKTGAIRRVGAGIRCKSITLRPRGFPPGGIVERDGAVDLSHWKQLSLLLRDPDFQTAIDVANDVDRGLGPGSAQAMDSRRIEVRIPHPGTTRCQISWRQWKI